MKESAFIDQNKEKWQLFEDELKNKSSDPHKISQLFVEVTDDLSYSQTYYKNRSVRVYLNGIAQILFSEIYKLSTKRKAKVKQFWLEEVPLQFYRARMQFLMAAILFLVFAGIGVYSSANDESFARLILGDGYVETTLKNIEKGDPMAIYKDDDALSMFFGITINNIRVALITFIFGVLGSIGTVAILVRNGVMVGTFQYFFVDSGNLQESFLTIWQHGTIEISSIIIAGGAGLYMGKGLIFPGTYRRSQAFKKTALGGVKIMLALIPLFVIAGFIESFLTRFTEIPDILRLVSILISLAFVLVYFVWYPQRVYKKLGSPAEEEIHEQGNFQDIIEGKILKTNEIFGNAIQLFSLKIGSILGYCVISAGLFALTGMFGFDIQYTYTDIVRLEQLSYQEAFSFVKIPFLGVASLFLVAAALLASEYWVRQESTLKPNSLAGFIKNKMFFALGVSLFMCSIIYIDNEWAFILSLIGTPILIIQYFCFCYKEHGKSTVFKVLKAAFGQFMLLLLMAGVLGFTLLMLITTPLLTFVVQSLTMLYDFEYATNLLIYHFILRFLVIFLLNFWLFALYFALAYFTRSCIEQLFATDLKKRITNLTSTNFSIR